MILLSLAACLLLMATSASGETCPSLVWSDEFDGNSLDTTNNWSHQVGNGCDIGLCGWGNNELQDYQAASTEVLNGFMKITADRHVSPSGQVQYTSSRINSIGKRSFQYGLFEARIKIPASQGFWPAFWMLGDNIADVGWPACGELDIMENIGAEPKTVHGTMHFGPPWPNNQYTGETAHVLGTNNFADDFHVFSMEKFEDKIRILVDGVVYMTRTPEDIAPQPWPFNGPAHFLLNVAIGGFWPGNPDSTTVFPSTMEVDYVRVYDNVFGDLVGSDLVSAGETGVVYEIADGLLSYVYSWTVPDAATIVSGQGTSSITVSFGSSPGIGTISAIATSEECGPAANRSFHLPISISARESSFLSSQEEASVTPSTTFLLSAITGVLNESVANPILTDGLNPSPNAFEYERNGDELYDVMTLSTTAIPNPEIFAGGGSNHFKMDLYTTAPTGTTIFLQLENSARSGLDYPTGRHSRYEATWEGGQRWQRLSFDFVNLPDPAETIVDSIVFLFAPNTMSNDIYYFDNLDAYSSSLSAASPTTTPQEPTDAPVTSPATYSPSSRPSLRSNLPTVLALTPPPSAPTDEPSFHHSNSPSTLAPSRSDPVPSISPGSSGFGFVTGGDNENDRATLTLLTGVWYDEFTPNPLPADPVNNEPVVVGYQRDGTELYDVIFYSTNAVPDPNEYSSCSGTRYFEMDIFAPVVEVGGTSVLLQLENSSRNGSVYPIGRHSRYEARLDVSSSSSSLGWRRVRFNFVDFPDPSETEADTITLLFAPGTFSSETYYFDNLDSVYNLPEEQAPTAIPTALPTNIASSAPSDTPSIAPIATPVSTGAFSLVTGGGDESNPAEASIVFSTGVWSTVPNPIPGDVMNMSPTVVQYQRNHHHQYDVIFYSTDLIVDPGDYSSGKKYFTLDVYSPTAPAGTVVLLQLENSARTGAGYPVGRHSRYNAILEQQGAPLGWQRLRFEFVDLPDPSEFVADRAVLLFAPGQFTSDVFFYDNLESSGYGL